MKYTLNISFLLTFQMAIDNWVIPIIVPRIPNGAVVKLDVSIR